MSKTRSGSAGARVLDDATRKRRQKRQLDSLEKDNFHDDPHAAFAHLLAKTKLPAFSDGSESMSAICYRGLSPCNGGHLEGQMPW